MAASVSFCLLRLARCCGWVYDHRHLPPRLRTLALPWLLRMFRTTLTLATPLCYGTTLALLSPLAALLFWVLGPP